jgi:septum formation protein
MINLKYPLILASKSPRRQQLLREAGFEFSIQPSPVKEDFPVNMNVIDIPTFLARKKAEGLLRLSVENIILSADTLVVQNDRILGKSLGNLVHQRKHWKCYRYFQEKYTRFTPGFV